MHEGKKEDADKIKVKVKNINEELLEIEKLEEDYKTEVNNIMMKIPNIIHESVPIGKDDSQNVEVQKYGEPVVPDYEIPYHTEIMEKFLIQEKMMCK